MGDLYTNFILNYPKLEMEHQMNQHGRTST